jgi:uncharacterized protein (TIRG00374 family)
MIERLYDIATVVLISAVTLLGVTPAPGTNVDFGRARLIGFVLMGLLIVAIAFLLWFKRHSQKFVSWLERRVPARSKITVRIKHALTSTLDQLATALTVLSDIRLFALTVFWSFMLWGFVVLANWIVCRAFGIPFGIFQVLFVLGWSMIGSVVPTPGGAAGAFHAATGAALLILGVGRDKAAAVAIILHLIDFAPAALFGLFYFLRGDVNFTRLRALVSVKAVEHAVEDEPVALAEPT